MAFPSTSYPQRETLQNISKLTTVLHSIPHQQENQNLFYRLSGQNRATFLYISPFFAKKMREFFIKQFF